ncbi:MAG TPA: alpha-L-rhamnosidase C-terminal domain-containing protein, partial [Bacteroidales bacterium]|nr:alpha-L-rhamnosidase C-terminal domain-containing protein [Bacteroidales bacterium]
AGSKIKVQYQEALFGEDDKKGNRNEWQGKKMKGYYDVFLSDGNTQQLEPLWIRVFRYIKITIDTKEEPLLVKDFYNIFTAYPLREKAYFKSDNENLPGIWDASWRTARLCALENYMDCPYYEQLQYIGDTRIQALISMMVAGDDRLARNAIHQLYNSMQTMGLTKSSHPCNGVQIIPPFSLVYIAMIHDYYMYRGYPELVQPFLPGIKFILEWFTSKITDNGMLGPLPYWNHIDGGTDFTDGSPPGISEGGSAHMTILLAYTLDRAAHLLRDFGDDYHATQLQKLVDPLKKSTMELCFNREKGLIAETPDQKVYSQHTNIFAILTNMFDEKQEKAVMEKVITDESLIQTTLYFKFYLFQAMKKAGFGGQIVDQMSAWEKFLDMGLTTFPEHGIESRSDCHAWSAHPMFDFLNVIAGVSPGSVGFKTIVIEPQLGDLTEVESGFPHPKGFVTMNYHKTSNGKLECDIILPEGLTGKLVYKGKEYSLKSGKNEM